MDSLTKNRLLRSIEREMRACNQVIINPEIPELSVSHLEPVLRMVARSRASYLKELFAMASESEGSVPDDERIVGLRALRETYEELLHGAKALETAIERGYLDIAED